MEAKNTVHWPGQDTEACEVHTIELKLLAEHMGFRLSYTPLPAEPAVECSNCDNEATRQATRQGRPPPRIVATIAVTVAGRFYGWPGWLSLSTAPDCLTKGIVKFQKRLRGNLPMLQPINDIDLELEQWRDHNPLDGSQIGGTQPVEYELVTDIPGQPGVIMLATKGPAWSTMEAYCPRPNFVAQGYAYVTESITFEIGPQSVPHILEFDLIRIVRVPSTGQVWHCDGSFQINIPKGYMLEVDTAPPAPPKVPYWAETGVKIAPLTFGQPHTLAIDHFTDIVANPAQPTHSVLSVIVDGVPYAIPAALQKIPATISTWPADTDYIQLQSTAESTGGMVVETFTAIALQHRTGPRPVPRVNL